ncbi:MAG TPA: hypothetical protein VD704_14265 [Gaiellaceae bacterium]|nr:hypothetical protein [Gaiellaceae bacterium]
MGPRVCGVELLLVGLLRDAEARAEDEAQVAERPQPGVELLGAQTLASGGLGEEPERLVPAPVELAADEPAVLGLALVVVLVGGRREPAEGGVAGGRGEQRAEVRRERAQEPALVLGEAQPVPAAARALDRALAEDG